MVDELDDLEHRGLFSRREIAEIVKQRRKFEYKLKRLSPLKQGFIAYIDYEKELEALRLLRKKAVAWELKKQNKKMKKLEHRGFWRFIGSRRTSLKAILSSGFSTWSSVGNARMDE
ncbi:unnamed protein product [Camellia sinensis]